VLELEDAASLGKGLGDVGRAVIAHHPGLIQSPSQGPLPGLAACVEVGGIASSLCSKAFPPRLISI